MNDSTRGASGNWQKKVRCFVFQAELECSERKSNLDYFGLRGLRFKNYYKKYY